MSDRAAIIFHITAAPIYSWRISSAYALSKFANTIKLCELSRCTRPIDSKCN